MKKTVLTLTLGVFLLGGAAINIFSQAKVSKISSAEFKADMRTLWDEHVTWTRCYIISALAGLEDADKTAARLLRNQDDIGNAVKPFYGDEAGTKLSKLLRDHIMTAAAVVKAAKENNSGELAIQQKKWSDNAEEMAVFLSGANPKWTKKELSAMLLKHLELTTGEVTGRLNKDWDADIQSYDKGHEHMMMFADMLSIGIIKQFPMKFMK